MQLQIKSMFLGILANGNIFRLFLVIFVLAGTGSLLQIGGGNWDITSHLLLQPETFFTPSHAILYSGILLLTISAIGGLYILLRVKEIRGNAISLPLKLLIMGSSLSLIAGPSDFLWHQIYGVDGFLSPTHLLLITGMLTNSFGSVFGLLRIRPFIKSRNMKTLNQGFIVIAFVALWLNLISYVYIFALPISNGDLFDFNLNPAIESLTALIFLPIVNATIAITILKTINKFGYLTLIGLGILLLTSLTNVLPSYEVAEFLPFYLLSVTLFFVVDIICFKQGSLSVYDKNRKSRLIISGAISGSLFYIIGYPWLPLALGNFLMPIDLETVGFTNLVDIIPIFENSLHIVLPVTIIIGAFMGALVTVLYSKLENVIIKRLPQHAK